MSSRREHARPSRRPVRIRERRSTISISCAVIADALRSVEMCAGAFDLNSEMGHLSVEIAHRERLVPPSGAVCELDVRDGPKVTAHLARFTIGEFDITPPRVPINNICCTMGRNLTGHSRPHNLWPWPHGGCGVRHPPQRSGVMEAPAPSNTTQRRGVAHVEISLRGTVGPRLRIGECPR